MILDKCADRFANELEVTSILQQIRETHGMIGNLLSKEQKELLKFSRDRYVNIQSCSSSSDFFEDSSQSSPEEKEDFGDEEFEKLQHRGDKFSKDIDHAFGYSIIKNMSLDYTQKKVLLDQYQEVKKAHIQGELEKKIASMMGHNHGHGHTPGGCEQKTGAAAAEGGQRFSNLSRRMS